MKRYLAICSVLLAIFGTPAWAMFGSDLQLNSGVDSSTNALLSNNGYAGTYINLASPGDVTVTANATGVEFGGVNPHMNIVIADTKAGFDVTPATFNDYSHTFENLPAGTYFVRTEFNNDAATSRSLTLGSLNVTGATIITDTDTTSLNADALAAADTYIANFRQGPGKVALVGVAPGTDVHVKLSRHAFNFGTNVHGTSDTGLLNANPAPGSNAENYQTFINEHFNMVEGSNAGKWTTNENTRDGSIATGMAWEDKMLQYAADHNMRARLHAMVWGNQQPTWVTNLLMSPAGTDTYNATTNPQGTNLNNLDALYSDLVAPAGTPNAGEPSEISERINYYVRDRATRYSELDVYNESYHTGVNGGSSTIWNRYGALGVSNIYDDVSAAAALAGADVRLYLNEYSALENQGGDAYANWYRSHIESLENADGDPSDKTVSGVGIQYYSGNGHSANLMMKALQNLSVLGLPMTLTEFGVQGSVASDADRIRNMNEAHRMLFGTPDATGFLYWGWWASATDATLQGGGVLVNADLLTLTPVGVAWEALRDSWNTDLTLPVGQGGTIDFTGFYGDYDVTINGNTYSLLLSKGDTSYTLIIAPGDYNGDGVVDAADYVVWRATVGSEDDRRADGNGDGVIDQSDYDVWMANFGNTFGSGAGGASTVPEPACIRLLVIGVVFAWRRRRSAQFAVGDL